MTGISTRNMNWTQAVLEIKKNNNYSLEIGKVERRLFWFKWNRTMQVLDVFHVDQQDVIRFISFPERFEVRLLKKKKKNVNYKRLNPSNQNIPR